MLYLALVLLDFSSNFTDVLFHLFDFCAQIVDLMLQMQIQSKQINV